MVVFDEKKVMREVNDFGIMEKRNVTTAYPGTKKVGGRDTNEACVVIGVHDKMHKDFLEKKDLIPKRLPSGVKTDVVIIGKVRPLSYEDPLEYWIDGINYDTFQSYMDTNDPNCAGERWGAAPSISNGCPRHSWKHRPLQGGISIAPYYFDFYSAVLGYVWDEGATGTLGAIVRDKNDGNLVGLTNNHVLSRDTAYYDVNYKVPSGGQQSIAAGTYITQPSFKDFIFWYRIGNRWDEIYGYEGADITDDERVLFNQFIFNSIVIGEAKRIVPIQFGTDADQNNLVDCGVASINQNLAYHGIYKLHAGPYPFATRGEYTTGDSVYISSRSTGFRDPDNDPIPYIVSINAITNVSYNGGDSGTAKYTDQIMLQTEGDPPISRGGDSGSIIIVYTGNIFKVVGLEFAGTGDGLTTYANHIDNVADELNIESWDGSITLPTHSYGASFDDVCYHKVQTVKRVQSHVPDYIYGNCEECADPVEYSFADEYGAEIINSIFEIPIVGEATEEKSIYLWFDRGDPQSRTPKEDCADGEYKITDVRISVANKEGAFSGGSNEEGQECVDEKWISVRSDGVRTHYCDEEMPDDNQTVFKPIGGGFTNADDYLAIGDFCADSARKILFKITIPEGAESETAVFPKIVVQYNVGNESSSSESSSSSLSSSSLSVSQSSSSSSSLSVSKSSSSSSSESSSSDSSSSDSSSSESSLSSSSESSFSSSSESSLSSSSESSLSSSSESSLSSSSDSSSESKESSSSSSSSIDSKSSSSLSSLSSLSSSSESSLSSSSESSFSSLSSSSESSLSSSSESSESVSSSSSSESSESISESSSSSSSESSVIPCMYSNADVFESQLTTLSGWNDGDLSAGVSSLDWFQGNYCFKIDCPTVSDTADRNRDLGSLLNDRYVITTRLYIDAVGSHSNSTLNGAELQLTGYDGTELWLFFAKFSSDGLFIYQGSGTYVEVGTDIVDLDQWIDWTFDINVADQDTATVDVYKNGSLVESGVSFANVGSADADGVVRVRGRSGNQVTLCYYDYVAIGTGCDTGWTPPSDSSSSSSSDSSSSSSSSWDEG
jgi:hypothetical protein